jgi:hypothetical protein
MSAKGPSILRSRVSDFPRRYSTEDTSVADRYQPLLTLAYERALAYLQTLPERPVRARDAFDELARALGGSLPDGPEDPSAVLDALVNRLDPGLVASPGPRYFGFVTGGSYPEAVAADWLVSAWDQNVGLHVMSPGMSALEACTARWVLDVLGLPEDASVGFVTGAHTANVTALAAARHEMLRRARWDVEAMGLQGAPQLTVIAGEEAHASIHAACRMIGVGSRTLIRVATDAQGRMRPERARVGSLGFVRADDRLRTSRQRQHRRVRPISRNRRAHARPRGLAARGRSLRPLGGCVAAAASSSAGRRRR